MVTAAPGDPEILAAPADRIYFAGQHTADPPGRLDRRCPAIQAARRGEILDGQHTAR